MRAHHAELAPGLDLAGFNKLADELEDEAIVGLAQHSNELIGLTDPAIFGFLRISTNPRLLRPPLPVEEAAGAVEEWLAEPNVRRAVPGPHHHALALTFLRSIGTAANLTTDVQLAAIAIENDAIIYSNDSGFARFESVRWINPLTA